LRRHSRGIQGCKNIEGRGIGIYEIEVDRRISLKERVNRKNKGIEDRMNPTTGSFALRSS
jgi:hypothetical protein